jgi:hypothetical protein
MIPTKKKKGKEKKKGYGHEKMRERERERERELLQESSSLDFVKKKLGKIKTSILRMIPYCLYIILM